MSTNLVVLALSKYIIRTLPCVASFDTRIKFLLGHIGFLCHIKGHSRSSSLVLASLPALGVSILSVIVSIK